MAVQLWNEELPVTQVDQVVFPPKLAQPPTPPTIEVAKFLAEDIDPSSTWTKEEKGYMSQELSQKNKSDYEEFCAELAQSKKNNSECAFTRKFDVAPQINSLVRLSNAFWLSHRQVSAVTVSANETLQGGGGQDKVIHFLAGPSLREETATFADDGNEYYDGFKVRCPTGQTRISNGQNLHQPYIIHLVAPYLDEKG